MPNYFVYSLSFTLIDLSISSANVYSYFLPVFMPWMLIIPNEWSEFLSCVDLKSLHTAGFFTCFASSQLCLNGLLDVNAKLAANCWVSWFRYCIMFLIFAREISSSNLAWCNGCFDRDLCGFSQILQELSGIFTSSYVTSEFYFVLFNSYNYQNCGHYPLFCFVFKHNVSETGLCLRVQVKSTNLGPTYRLGFTSKRRQNPASKKLSFKWKTGRWILKKSKTIHVTGLGGL
jgi:hypothetical protein